MLRKSDEAFIVEIDMRRLQIQRNEIGYTGYLNAPAFHCIGNMNAPTKALAEAFQPFGFGVDSIQVFTGAQFLHQQGVLCTLGLQGSYTFKLDRVEAIFRDLDDTGLQRASELLLAADRSLRTQVGDFGITRHHLIYSAHGGIAPGTAMDLLEAFVPARPKSGGIPRGAGIIFHWEIPEKAWSTQLTLDRSLLIKDGLFVFLVLDTSCDNLHFPEALTEGRRYLTGVLKELGIELPKAERTP